MGRNDNNDPPHFLREWRELRGLTQEQLAERVGIIRSQISKIEKGVAPLMQNRLATFAQALRIEVPQLYSPPPASPAVEGKAPPHANKSLVSSPNGGLRSASGEPDLFGPKNLQVLGFAKAGQIGWYPDNGSTLEMTERPPMLAGVPDAYALYIDDMSMFPALKPGHMVYVHPTKAARPGDYVIVQISEETAYIKELVKRTDKQIVCKQYNPDIEVKYPVTAKIHVVVGVRLVG